MDEKTFSKEIVGDILNRTVFMTSYSIIMYAFTIIMLASVGIDIDIPWSILIWSIALGIGLLLVLKKDLMVLRKIKKNCKKTA